MNSPRPIDTPGSADASAPLKVGFLYNHDELHQVAHTAPIISALQRQYPSITVEILSSSEAQTEAVKRHLDPALPEPKIHALKRSKALSFAEKLIGSAAPLGRIGFLTANRDLLGSYDALVVPETTTTLLKTKLGLTDTRLIHIPHGAGDRSICVSPDIAHFDFVMLPGEKTRARMLESRVVREGASAVVGYPKFDSRTATGETPIFDNDRPTVFYNPHFDPKLSSWFKFGIPMLEYFANQDRYNLIVAPHVMLFRRKVLASVEHRVMKIRKAIPDRFKSLDHIHIDEGSLNSVDMTYTRMADVYVGDVSSQVYEFIERPRPAIFLNSHDADWRNDESYFFWNFGPVVDDFADFEAALNLPAAEQAAYAKRQAEIFADAIDIKADARSSHRAADAIADFLNREFPDRAVRKEASNV
ncbi:hypothetical protein [Pontixanthobacter aquaemixtae]|uniref:CDP-Glycerol:Poly(Glycerophosphate) glycerophosphotransferase n=1 Tax=Pontixanthobacter aquaemixtae TaxID=1958940 RepID=A0A844ZU37_9SPHN|nr:hypothetical protein [Pontixanthobacter aquaemixtae]MXO90984.1 hypothetical protein [Pontixanthobacter aquaemixtae]